MATAYANDVQVREMTKFIVDSGSRVLQIFQRGNEDEHVKFLLEHFEPPRNALVLDVGCGVGEVARLMNESRPDLEFMLLNISQAQLDMCPNFKQLCASVEDIPLPDESIDAVMACYVLGHVDLDLSMHEMQRVLKRGGVLFIYDLHAGRYLPELDYTAHRYCGWHPNGMNTDSFSRFMPNFTERFPDVKPVIVRMVKQ